MNAQLFNFQFDSLDIGISLDIGNWSLGFKLLPYSHSIVAGGLEEIS